MEYQPSEAAREGRELVGRSIMLKAERYKWDEGWKIIAYDDEKDRFLIAPTQPDEFTTREDNQWVKRDKFDPI